ncbi:hypothetical protein [Pseudoxanthomonas dokdonensis]|uniref:hypothetical protein n=1 Tax=Pseudoxanthomonas dokdonensis TaxID=344882 RepID=UPI000B1B15E8|nr:hypothetical protein [Pseudoxanthomonas dokdonensis]
MKAINLVVLLMMALGPAVAAPASAADVRHGVVVDRKPIENRGTDETQSYKKKKSFGRNIGQLAQVWVGPRLLGKNDAVDAAVQSNSGGAVGEAVAAKVSDRGPTTRYMVKIRLDSGKILAITQLGETLGDIKAGSRVKVEGRGDDARISAE